MIRYATTSSPRLRAAILGLAIIAGLSAATVAAPPAHAALSSTTCTGTSDITYQPGLTNTAQTVTYDETDTYSCGSTDLTLTGGSDFVSVILPGASCLALPSLTTSTPLTITWNNGHSTTISLSFTDVIVEGIEQVTGTGPVTSGEFHGANATIAWEYAVPDPLQCATSQGVTTQTGILTAQITGI